MSHTDIKQNKLIAMLPEAARPYALLMRLDRPIGIWLLLLPGLWSIAMASGDRPFLDTGFLKAVALFALGAVIMRGAGCIVNDLWDVRFDRAVERTRTRPLASGAIKPWQAAGLLLALFLFGLVILLQFELVTILLGFLSLPLIVLYPLMKRWTWWPQAFLGLTFNFGALMGWSAMKDVLEPAALLLYAAGFFWTLGYDTIYAHQDKEDDALVGVKSTARLFGSESRQWVAGFYGVSFFLLALAGLAGGAGILYFLALVPAAAHHYRQVTDWAMDDPRDSLRRFKAARDFGLIVFVGAVLGRLF
ncbi:MAG: 4-hydroxybenzoate octaprenyltransferase [Alphaproteobacteria bacterium]|nr:4-hydroxybenzoate octaprenyltransferase [Alphaproteobacteria bacterium]